MKIFPMRCPISGCEFHLKTIYCDILQIKFHLIQKHDYQDYQAAAERIGLARNGSLCRSRGWFIGNLAEASIIVKSEDERHLPNKKEGLTNGDIK